MFSAAGLLGARISFCLIFFFLPPESLKESWVRKSELILESPGGLFRGCSNNDVEDA